MLETQAVIGRIQLQRMPLWTAQRQANAKRIAAVCLQHKAVRVPIVPPDVQHAFYKFYAFVEPANLAPEWSRDRILDEILAQGVTCSQGSCSEVYLEKAFDNTGFRPAKRLQVAQELGETSLMFQVHPTLTDGDVEKMCQIIGDVLFMAGKKASSAVRH
jgi:dTDP-4-amino-4,6-dideoxygalactose transaminase